MLKIKRLYLSGGFHERIRSGNSQKNAKKSFSFALITISTSRYEKYGSTISPEEAEDLSGKAMKELLEAAGSKVSFYRLVPDGKDAILDALFAALDSSADVVITTGGTGLAPKDITIESISPLFEKEIPGFGELFRYKSLEEIGTSLILTRASAGVIKGRCNERIGYFYPQGRQMR